MSKQFDLDTMSVDEMWQLHERIIQVLSDKLTSEKRELEKRLAKLRRDKQIPRVTVHDAKVKNTRGTRRKYPGVIAKYQNPAVPSETWSGRGKRPRWLTSAITAGHTIEEFAIIREAGGTAGQQRA